MIYIDRFFLSISNHLKRIYLNSNFYDKKISKVKDNPLIYKPSPHLLSSLIKYQKKKFKIEEEKIVSPFNSGFDGFYMARLSYK